MDIEGLDYNTSRKKLVLPEYGREVQEMVDYALTIDNRKERQRCAESIIKVMQRVSPQMSRTEETLHKYWDHLAVMSGLRLDIDYPFDIEQAKKINARPAPMSYSNNGALVCHYGVLLFELFETLKSMPEGEQRDRLIERTVNQMRICLKEFSPGSADEEKVASDLAYYTDGAVQIDPNTLRFANVHHPKRQPEKKKKKK